MATYFLEPQADTLHGCFSHDLPPALTIDPGDTVRCRTLDADWILEPPDDLSKSLGWTDWKNLRRFEPRTKERDDGHALIGPIHIRGAQPGMMLAVHINRIVSGTWGWALPWFGASNERKDDISYMLWTLDTAKMIGRSHQGHTVALRPFLGVMGNAVDEPGYLSTTPPRAVGGNLDCKELVAGSTVYLPIAVAGGLFSFGDGHATQGDGESSGTAIECPMQRVDLTFELIENPPIPTIHANTPAGWLTFGFHEDLNIAADSALAAMLDLLSARYGVSRMEALTLAGVAIDLRITQIVNQVKGVHAVLPHGAIR